MERAALRLGVLVCMPAQRGGRSLRAPSVVSGVEDHVLARVEDYPQAGRMR